ncbi:MAG TPA: glycosyltransferase [Acidimicrobiia bacterium]|nr:glycosyltransferase [Acidimicrobiia bacterium]
MARRRFSVITPVYDPPAEVLRSTVRSVRDQTFANWELCLVDDASTSSHVGEVLREVAASDPRILVERRTSNGGIAAASNDALAMASGELLVLLDHDDELHRDALRIVDEAVAAQPDADYVYSDEDKIDESGRHFGPFYKPGWSPERFRTQMYTCHLSVLRAALVDEVGGFRLEYDGSQDWDLILRVTERARRVVHIPRVLYHWRTVSTSVASGGEVVKPFAYSAGTRTLQDHCDRVGFPARVEHSEEHPGVYELVPALDEHPRVSIVIPTGGALGDVGAERICLVTRCVGSILAASTYPNYEIVVVADTTTPAGVLGELSDLVGQHLRVVPYDLPFNFSDKINTGVLASTGTHVLMLNDDTEVVTPSWLERLVMYSNCPGIGAVGAKLLYGDGRLQHVGVTVSGSLPQHPYRGFAGDHGGYFNVVHVASDYSAVTGACLMTERCVFDEVGGLSTLLPHSFNDVDYCLKVGSIGQRVAYDPGTVLRHFESASRAPEASEAELQLLRDRWGSVMQTDPYESANFHPGSRHQVPPIYHADGTVLI